MLTFPYIVAHVDLSVSQGISFGPTIIHGNQNATPNESRFVMKPNDPNLCVMSCRRILQSFMLSFNR
jgi:hypothetical protein